MSHVIAVSDPLPSSIELSDIQREVLELIGNEFMAAQRPVWPGRAILAWSGGVAPPTIARELDLHAQTVRALRHRWLSATARIATAERKLNKVFADLVNLIFDLLTEETTPEGAPTPSVDLASRTSSERPATAKELRPTAKALIEILHHKPAPPTASTGVIGRYKASPRLLKKVHGQRPSKSSVGRLLKQAGFSWKKSRKVLTSPDPNYREKVELLLKTLQSLNADEDLFFIDELGPLQVRRYAGRCFTPKGRTPTHPQNPRAKGSITLYGALSAMTNQVTWFYGSTKDSAGMIDLLEIFYNQYHNKSKIYLTWDAASWHGSQELVEWATERNAWNDEKDSGPTIAFGPLPSSAQFLDVIEAVFSAMKRAVIHGSDYPSEEEMKNAISTHFTERNAFFKQNF